MATANDEASAVIFVAIVIALAGLFWLCKVTGLDATTIVYVALRAAVLAALIATWWWLGRDIAPLRISNTWPAGLAGAWWMSWPALDDWGGLHDRPDFLPPPAMEHLPLYAQTWFQLSVLLVLLGVAAVLVVSRPHRYW